MLARVPLVVEVSQRNFLEVGPQLKLELDQRLELQPKVSLGSSCSLDYNYVNVDYD